MTISIVLLWNVGYCRKRVYVGFVAHRLVMTTDCLLQII